MGERKMNSNDPLLAMPSLRKVMVKSLFLHLPFPHFPFISPLKPLGIVANPAMPDYSV